jgi:hypothetical protein
MKKLLLKSITVIFFVFLTGFSYADSKELCDCYGSCMLIQPRHLTASVKKLVKIKYGYPPSSKMEIDHMLPLSLGGSNNIDNLWPLTYEEHKLKTKNDMMILFFVRNCFMTIEEAQNDYEK